MTTISAQSVPRKKLPGVNGQMTEQQFVDWCDDDTWAEWVDGKAVLMSPVNVQHGELLFFLARLLGEFIDEHDLGVLLGEPVHVRFAKLRRRRSPDLFFVAADRLQIVKEAHIEGAPDLIIEIISPQSQSRDRREKFLEYQAAGVREYWIVDPLSRTVEPYTLGEGHKYRAIDSANAIKSLVLPGFVLKPAWLWRPKFPKVSTCLREMKSRK